MDTDSTQLEITAWTTLPNHETRARRERRKCQN